MCSRLIVLATAVCVSPLTAQQGPAPHRTGTQAPLFAAHERVVLTIRAPLATILEDRSQDSEEVPGTVLIHRPGAQAVPVPVQIRTRGRTRLQRGICQFPPLRLDFAEAAAAGSVFEGQDKLKLVTHCQDRSESVQHVLLEYLVYRTYELFTDLSFRVRLATITYQDTATDDEPVTRTAFFIEDDDRMAARNGWDRLELPALPLPAVDTANLALVETFQYFIGNTDFSALVPDSGETECCHNVQLIGKPRGPVFAVPYDFDLSGVVNPRYANRLYRRNLARFGIRSLRDRVYRGWCGSRPYVPAVLERFREKRAAIARLYRSQTGLDQDVLEETIAFFDEFYAVIDDAGSTQREILGKCRQVG
jgi:hypothetical protein